MWLLVYHKIFPSRGTLLKIHKTAFVPLITYKFFELCLPIAKFLVLEDNRRLSN